MYLVRRSPGSWEVRESRSTSRGPRSRTLATFKELTPEVIDLAMERASKPVDPDELRRIALRVGAPVATDAPDRHARGLLHEIAGGRRPRRVLARMLLDQLSMDAGPLSDDARSVAEWVGASDAERGEALRDLLLLADALPAERRGDLRFPPLGSAG